MSNLSQILTWKQRFGLLPIHLNPHSDSSDFVMLNGGHGDFCLQTIKEDNIDGLYFSKSWSSNTKNFVVIDNDLVRIYNWNKNRTEEIKQNYVLENFDKFYQYLLSQSNKSDRDIVPFIINIFRQIRNITKEKSNPIEALNLLFVLLASLEDDYVDLDRNKWNLNDSKIPDGFNVLADKLKSGIGTIKPQIDIIIRHSSGVLFQEAQKEVLLFDGQLSIWDGASDTLKTKNTLYSSVHYTPSYIARAIVENSIRKLDLSSKTLKIFDPACGSSEFLMEALKQLKELDYQGEIEVIGWDSSQTAINTSNFLLKYEQRTVWGNKLKFKIKLVVDSLLEKWDRNYDLILMNPPFVSWELLATKDSVRETLGKNFGGKPNQASAFFYKSIKSLGKDGVIGCIVPSSLLTLDAYKDLRNEVYDLISIDIIGKLGNFVFEDALTDVSLIIGHKPKSDTVPQLLWTKNERGVAQNALRDLRKMYYSNELTVNNVDYSIFQPIKFPIINESWKSISYSENELLKKIELLVEKNRLTRVKNVFDVQQGIRTGSNNIFKISKDDFLGLTEKEKKYFRPVADNESIKNGVLHSFNYVWYPYNETGLILTTEAMFKSKAPKFYSRIIKYKNELSNRARKDVSNWWHLSEHRAWLRKNTPRLVSSEFGRSDSFAFDEKGIYAVERGNAWLPSNDWESAFLNLDLYYFYLALFSSSYFDRLLSIYSKQLAGGSWYDLGRKYTGHIPIPKIHIGDDFSEDIDRIHPGSGVFIRMVAYGKLISRGELFEKYELNEIIEKYIYFC